MGFWGQCFFRGGRRKNLTKISDFGVWEGGNKRIFGRSRTLGGGLGGRKGFLIKVWRLRWRGGRIRRDGLFLMEEKGSQREEKKRQ